MGFGGDESLLRESLLDGFDFAGIGMRPPQAYSLLRFLQPAASITSVSHSSQNILSTELAVKECLVDILSRAKLFPSEMRVRFAEKLYNSGIGDEVALRECLLSDPHYVAAEVGINGVQIKVLQKFFIPQ
jgi:hypothetical protein